MYPLLSSACDQQFALRSGPDRVGDNVSVQRGGREGDGEEDGAHGKGHSRSSLRACFSGFLDTNVCESD